MYWEVVAEKREEVSRLRVLNVSAASMNLMLWLLQWGADEDAEGWQMNGCHEGERDQQHPWREEDESLEKCITTGVVEGTRVEEVDHEGRGVMAPRNGHICQQKIRCS